ncbi:MAG: GspH/FimT family pseudopilin [Desulfobacterales bacterium]|nr:GspH/FimT family pseudopilin [Desulfobacterales bacterium]
MEGLVGMMKAFQKKCLTTRRGFTLVEIMTVVAIIGILASISVPGFYAWRASARLRGASLDLMSDLSMARMHAVKKGEEVSVRFATEGYKMFIDANNDGAPNAGEEILRQKSYPPGVAMRQTTFTDAKTAFHPSGAVCPAGSVGLGRGTGSPMRIIVNLVGRIRVAKG